MLSKNRPFRLFDLFPLFDRSFSMETDLDELFLEIGPEQVVSRLDDR